MLVSGRPLDPLKDRSALARAPYHTTQNDTAPDPTKPHHHFTARHITTPHITLHHITHCRDHGTVLCNTAHHIVLLHSALHSPHHCTAHPTRTHRRLSQRITLLWAEPFITKPHRTTPKLYRSTAHDTSLHLPHTTPHHTTLCIREPILHLSDGY